MLTDRASIVLINGPHFVDAARAKGPMVAFGDAKEFALLVAKYALACHSRLKLNVDY